MRLPKGGPLLEFGFYWSDISETEAMTRLVVSLVSHGAVWRGGICWAITSHNMRSQPVDVGSYSDLEAYLTDPRIQVVDATVYLEHATGTVHGIVEEISYRHLSNEVAQDNQRPISIITDGHWTETWLADSPVRRRESRRHARTLGRHAKEQFCTLVEDVKPSYAAIMVECSLPTPAELCRKADAYAFSDFWVNSHYVGVTALATIQRLYEGAYTEPVGNGLYVSCYEYFNPQGKSMGEDRYSKSEQVSRFIAIRG